MASIYTELERRVSVMETQIKELYDKSDCTMQWQARNGEKLDNMLINIGELKNAVALMKDKPGRRWEHFIMSVIGSVAVLLAGIVLKLVLGG